MRGHSETGLLVGGSSTEGMWDDHDMSNADQTSYERTEFEVRWNQRSFAWNMAGIFLFFLVYVAVAVLASGTFRLVGVAGVIVFGVYMVMGGVSRANCCGGVRWPWP